MSNVTEPGTDRARRTSLVPLTALCLGFFLVTFDVTVVSIAIPQIGGDLGAGLTALQWVSDGYTLVFAALLLNAGTLGDRYGGKAVFLAGLAVFGVASLACGVAPSPLVLVVARLVQGTGAALMVPTSLSLLRAVYTTRAERARAFGAWSVVAGAAGASGPVVAGLLVEFSTWRSIFLLNIPLTALALWLASRFVPSQSGRPDRRIDWPGQILSTIALGLLVASLNEGGARGWTSPLVVAGFVGAVLAGLMFVRTQFTSSHPTLPPELLTRAEFTSAAAVGFVFNFGYFGLLFALPIYFERVLGLSTLATALAIIPMAGPPVLLSLLAGRWVARRGSRAPAAFGLLLGALGTIALVPVGAGIPYVVLLLPLLLAGLTPAFTMPASTAAIMESVPADQGGTASGVFNMSRQVGSALGVALFGSLLTADLASGTTAALCIATAAFVGGAGLATVGLPGHDSTRRTAR